jgi:hypothetical protein
VAADHGIFFFENRHKDVRLSQAGSCEPMSIRKEFRELLDAVEAQGGTMTLHGTPSDRRALANAMAELRRAGFTLRGR